MPILSLSPRGWRPGTLIGMGRRRMLGFAMLTLLVVGVAPGWPAATPRPVPAGNAGAAPAAPAAGSGYRLPLTGTPTVTRPFEPPPKPWMAGHRGVDLAADPGAEVLAAGPGVVAFAGTVAGVGVVSVEHPDGLRTTYQPVLPLVSAGQAVSAGEPIGTLLPGHPGCPVAACLHWGLRSGDQYLDPMSLLGAGPVRLYPVDS